jgi:hypothetical protein
MTDPTENLTSNVGSICTDYNLAESGEQIPTNNIIELTNFIHIPPNKFYKDVQEMIEEEEISFYNKFNWDKIKYNIERIIKKNNFTISNLCDKEILLENIIVKIIKNQNTDANTILLYADDENMYELIYEYDYNKRDFGNIYNDTNELASISNINLEVIYNDTCIIKTNYSDGILKNSIITNDDLIEIINNIFFHTGIIISEDGNMIEVTYTSEMPNYIIGDEFIKYKTFDVLNFTLLLYVEKSNNINETVSKIIGEEIKGRVFITLLCPISNTRIWNIKKITIENILKILNDKKKYENTLNELENDEKIKNSFYFIKKNCIL